MSGTHIPVELSPVAVENAIRDCSNRIAKGVIECNRTYVAFLDAERAYDKAFAHAYLDHDGPAHEKRYAAELVTTDLRQVRDVADAAYRFCDRNAKALQDELRAWQSVNASLRSAYAVAGTGER